MALVYVVTRHGSGAAAIAVFTDAAQADELCAAYIAAFPASDATYEVEICSLDAMQDEVEFLTDLKENA